MGGTGKTPACLLVADIFSKAGKRVAVISRGYRGRAKQKVNIVSDGNNILLNEEKAGDEPYLMAKKLKTIPVLTGRSRFLGGSYACDNFGVDVVVLDDGFQHLGLERDLDICLVNNSSGFGNGFILPRGTLREPLEAINRADIFLITGSSLNNQYKIHESIAKCKKNPIVFRADYQVTYLRKIGNGEKLKGNYLKGKNVFAFSGIADPQSFISQLQSLGANVAGKYFFPDHHRYSKRDLEKVREKADKTDLIITTEKDGVKLEFEALIPGFAIFVLAISMKVENEDRFKALILSVFNMSH